MKKLKEYIEHLKQRCNDSEHDIYVYIGLGRYHDADLLREKIEVVTNIITDLEKITSKS
jgi:hypothetical protein